MHTEQRRQLGIAAAIPSLGIILIGIFLYLHDRSPAVLIEKIPTLTASSTTSMILTSPSFNHSEKIPDKFTCDGGNINPQLVIGNVPTDAQSLALIMDDPDAPGGTFTHWTMWNIDPATTVIKEESIPSKSVEGTTSFGKVGYGGSCPPPGKAHRYFFKLYALNSMLDLPERSKRVDLEKEIKKHFITETQLVGTYQRK